MLDQVVWTKRGKLVVKARSDISHTPFNLKASPLQNLLIGSGITAPLRNHATLKVSSHKILKGKMCNVFTANSFPDISRFERFQQPFDSKAEMNDKPHNNCNNKSKLTPKGLPHKRL